MSRKLTKRQKKKLRKGFMKLPMPMRILSVVVLVAVIAVAALFLNPETPPSYVSLDDIPEFDGKNAYVVINDNTPFFDGESREGTYESYSDLDVLGRCGAAIACIGPDLMPAEGEKRDSISSVTPSGWQSIKYDIVDGGWLYNRAHLIGWQLTAENANKENLITGTRYFNVTGMLPFENMVADYIRETGERVLYRVTPVYDGDNLVASGVLMEALSIDDGGAGICFCVYVYNVQPGVRINYATGESSLD